jgi:methylated-DNA-[protein]-cysteine S-methyltransferase
MPWSEFEPRPGFRVVVTAEAGAITRIEFGRKYEPDGPADESEPLMREALNQLRAYFAGRLNRFDLPLKLLGTDFQKLVWRALQTIPYGQTRSYGQIAKQIEAPTAFRAVGAANGSNRIPIVIPCHRVIGANGSLVGFGGGLAWKKMLLDLEAQHAGGIGKAATR